MDKKRSKTSKFSLELGNNTGSLPTPDDIEKTIAKATGKELKETSTSKESVAKEPIATDNKQRRRIPLTTAITPENRADLEVLVHSGKGSVADIINAALEHYFANVQPVEDNEMRAVFLKLFQKGKG